MSSSSTELNCWKKDTQSSALHVMRCEDSSLMFKMPTEKMQWIHLSAAASINNWQIPSYSQIIASTTLPENYLYFFFLNQTILQLDHFFHHFHSAHFSKHVPTQMKCHFSSQHCYCSKIQPCQTPVLEVRSPKASESSQLHSTSKRKKTKLQRTIQMRFMTKFHENAKAKSSLRLWCLHFLQLHGSFQGKQRQRLFKIFLPAHSSHHGHKSSSSWFLQT